MHIQQPVRTATLLTVVVLVAVATLPPEAPAQRLDPRFDVGDRFPEIVFPSLDDGTPTSIADFRGKKLLLHVFASW